MGQSALGDHGTYRTYGTYVVLLVPLVSYVSSAAHRLCAVNAASCPHSPRGTPPGKMPSIMADPISSISVAETLDATPNLASSDPHEHRAVALVAGSTPHLSSETQSLL